jgi:uncharacterized protein (TIGR03435 family)
VLRHLEIAKILSLIAIVLTAFAQDSVPIRPEFEVATIKPNSGGSGNVAIVPTPGGGFHAENVTLKLLIQLAYRVSEMQIQGGPPWISSARYDIVAKAIVAKAETSKPFPDMSPMLQSLLEERFKLTFHRETKEEVSACILVPAKSGRKLTGAQDFGCAAPAALTCGTIRMTNRQLDGSRITIDALTKALAAVTGRIVIDRTGYKELIDVHLEWTPEGAPDDPDSIHTSIYTELQEKLGLELEARKSPAEILVIDRAERPVED